MEQFRVLVSLTTKDNDYQRELAAAAAQAASRLSMKVEIIFADNDAITQSQQLLQVIQSRPEQRPHAIALEPVGTALPQVASAAVKANIAWVVMNREAEYLSELRRGASAFIFSVTSDHVEIGRIQGRQLSHLLPEGGHVLYVQGPSSSSTTRQRTKGMLETKPENVQVRMLSAQWTEVSAYKATTAFMRLRTSLDNRIDAVCSQNDLMALGVRKALKEMAADWSWIPFTGVDGLKGTGQRWVNEGVLSATVVVPTLTDIALDMLHQALFTKKQPDEITLTRPRSYPELEKIRPAAKQATLQQS
jgi:ABC-type sugar transport system substrate-binding protein